VAALVEEPADAEKASQATTAHTMRAMGARRRT
jgi:hypothetical protein